MKIVYFEFGLNFDGPGPRNPTSYGINFQRISELKHEELLRLQAQVDKENKFAQSSSVNTQTQIITCGKDFATQREFTNHHRKIFASLFINHNPYMTNQKPFEELELLEKLCKNK